LITGVFNHFEVCNNFPHDLSVNSFATHRATQRKRAETQAVDIARNSLRSIRDNLKRSRREQGISAVAGYLEAGAM
jgi:hypothetical protein